MPDMDSTVALADNSCSICGLNDRARFRIYFDGPQKLYRCGSCGFVSQYCGPGASSMVESYEDSTKLGAIDRGQQWIRPDRARVLGDIADRIRAAGGAGKLLDVGCADGQFLSICAEKGLETYGVEESRVRADYAAEHSGARIMQGRFSENMFAPGTFDVISFIQVLEHIARPREVLAIAHTCLRPGGIVCVEVPSRFSPHFFLYRLTRVKRIVETHWGVIDSHVGYHHPGSVRRMAAEEGFEEISLTTGRWWAKYLGWKGSVGKAMDPLLNRARVGGILYLGRRV
jgi:2-polyprenyl-3-methyl-5-hydroxy-6-metoxy-1,4-benzoquinol methylase